MIRYSPTGWRVHWRFGQTPMTRDFKEPSNIVVPQHSPHVTFITKDNDGAGTDNALFVINSPHSTVFAEPL